MINDKNIYAAVNWLKQAQDITKDGGVSAWYSLIFGWRPSYVETTGYIINTFFDLYKYYNEPELKRRGIIMADFLIEMQLPNGGYKAYTPKQKDSNKVIVFDTGQDLLGITQAYEVTKEKKYLKSAIRAADYLVSIQEKDGSWIKNTFGDSSHVYHTRVAWGLLKVYQISKKIEFKKSAIRNLVWASKYQNVNGWFKNNELLLPNESIPYTHTISYAIEGFLWSGLILNDSKLLNVALKGATPLLNYYIRNNYLPASLDKNWESIDKYTCLTGNAQISLMWLELYKVTKEKRFLIGASKMNKYLKSKQNLKSPFSSINGAIAGSDPIYGDILNNKGYCRFAYLNWATKFFIDSLLSEKIIWQKKQNENI